MRPELWAKGVGAASDLRREKSRPAGSSSLVETLPASLAAQHTLTKNEMLLWGGLFSVCVLCTVLRGVWSVFTAALRSAGTGK